MPETSILHHAICPPAAASLVAAFKNSPCAAKEGAIRAEIQTGRVQQSWLEPFLQQQAR